MEQGLEEVVMDIPQTGRIATPIASDSIRI
jgi:hypothetical protein